MNEIRIRVEKQQRSYHADQKDAEDPTAYLKELVSGQKNCPDDTLQDRTSQDPRLGV